MKPTKSILCHRSNSGSSPRRPLSRHSALPPSLSLPFSPSLSLVRALRSSLGVFPFVACHPSFHPRHALRPKLLSGYSRREFASVGVEFLSPQPSSSSPRTSNYGSRDVHDQPRGNKPLSTGCLSRYSAAFHGGLGLPASMNRQTVSRLYGVGSFDFQDATGVSVLLSLFYSWGYGLGLRTCSYSGLRRSLVYIYGGERRREKRASPIGYFRYSYLSVASCVVVV